MVTRRYKIDENNRDYHLTASVTMYFRNKFSGLIKYRHSIAIHILVSDAFFYAKEELPMIDHINNKKHDNRIENLRRTTNQGNQIAFVMSMKKDDPYYFSKRLGSDYSDESLNQLCALLEENELNLDEISHKTGILLYDIHKIRNGL